MIGRIYRLVDAQRIEMVQREVGFDENTVLVKPDYLSICAADNRYYFGMRKREVLDKKLPMALIHEATATVLYDSSGGLESGSKVVLVPLVEKKKDIGIKANYVPENIFLSSGHDGFLRDYCTMDRNCIVPIIEDYSIIFVFSEMLSVVVNALEAFERSRVSDVGTVGVWGDGSMGYVTSLVVRSLYPEAEILVFGRSLQKLQRFSFANQTLCVDDVPHNLRVNHCFECVGGQKSERAIRQMMDVVTPQGCISLMGVSEASIAIDTRTVLEKGLTFIGNSRSNAEDMRKAVKLIQGNEICRKYLPMLISEIVDVKSERDITHAFEQSSLHDFKTVMRWGI
jgi:ribitol-5-phosphate 2-dehydrogenase